jgi:hypothetical protein
MTSANEDGAILTPELPLIMVLDAIHHQHDLGC